MIYKNETGKPKHIRLKNRDGYYVWRWVEPNQEIDIDKSLGEMYNLSEVKAFEVKISTTKIETKRKKVKKKKPKNARKKVYKGN